MRFLLILLFTATLFIAACNTASPSSPSYHAYGNASNHIKNNVTTFEDMKQLYGECISQEPTSDGYRCLWKHQTTVVYSTESDGALQSTEFDPGRNQKRFTNKITYTSILTAVFNNGNVLKNYTVRNFIEK